MNSPRDHNHVDGKGNSENVDDSSINLQREQKEQLTQAEQLVDAVNHSSSLTRSLYLAFIAFTVFLFVITSTTDDVDLLLRIPVDLPLFGVAVDLEAFYRFAPWVYCLAHINMLMVLALLSKKLSVFHSKLSHQTLETRQLLRTRLHVFAPVQYLSRQHQGALKFALWSISRVILIWVPPVTILWLQIDSLAMQDESIVWFQRTALAVDAIFTYALWTRMLQGGARSLAEVRLKFSTIIVLGFILVISLFGATIPLSKWEQIIAGKSCDPENAVAISSYPSSCNNLISSWLFDGWFYNYRRLNHIAELDSGRLLKFGDTPLSDIEAHKLKNDTNRNESKWRAQNRRFSFNNKNYRFADFSKLNLSLSDFNSSNLQGANFKETVLNGAIFQNNTKLTGANFEEADMLAVNFENIKASKAIFENSHISRSVFKESLFDYSDFRESRISDTFFKSVNFQNTIFKDTKIFGSSFDKVLFDNAKLNGSRIYATDIGGKNRSSFKGSEIKGVQFFGINLKGDVEFDGGTDINESIFLYSDIGVKAINQAKGWSDTALLLGSGCKSTGCKGDEINTYLSTNENKSLSLVSKNICEKISEKLLNVDKGIIDKYGDLQLALWFFSNSNKSCLFNYSKGDVWNKDRMNERAHTALKHKGFEPLIRTLSSLYLKGYSCDLGFCKKKPQENIKKLVENRMESVNSKFKIVGGKKGNE